MIQPPVKALHSQPRLPLTPNNLLWAMVLGVLVMFASALVYLGFSGNPSISIGSTGVTSIDAAAAQLYSADPDKREQAIASLGLAAQSGSDEAATHLETFFQRDTYLITNGLATARAIGSAATRPAYQSLIQALRLIGSPTRRYAAMAALEEARPNVATVLIAALQDPDAGVRSSSAELLGYRHEVLASAALIAATYDTEPTVRAAAAWTLGGDLAVWYALPRMQVLAVGDPDARVRAAAQLAETRIRGNIAHELGIAPADMLLVSVAPANGLIYAATQSGLYAIRDSSHWKLTGVLPGYPTALAVGGLDGQVVYVGTMGSGPFRSIDGGRTWERILTGLPVAEQLSVTALTITADSDDAQDVTMALGVTVGTTELHTTPLGVFQTTNGGDTWALVAPGSAANNY